MNPDSSEMTPAELDALITRALAENASLRRDGIAELDAARVAKKTAVAVIHEGKRRLDAATAREDAALARLAELEGDVRMLRERRAELRNPETFP